MSFVRALSTAASHHQLILPCCWSRCRTIINPARCSFRSLRDLTIVNRRLLTKGPAPHQAIIQDHLDKNILIYRNSGFRFFHVVGVFALMQLGFWSYLTYSAMTSMTDSRAYELVKYGPEGAPSDKKNWTTLSGIRMKLHSGTWRYTLTAICVCVGAGIFAGATLYCRRCIHRIVLRKGGDRVTFTTFGFFGRTSSFTAPVLNTSCMHSRHSVRSQLPIKVRGHRFFYMMANDGKLYNAPLFDRTVGMRRMFPT